MQEIYYIEDDRAIGAIVKNALSHRGYAVSLFGTLVQARAALEGHCPAAVLLDWNMPDGEGRDFCRWLRGQYREVPILFLTVRDDTRDVVTGFDCGADDYVTKPFDLDILQSRVAALLRRSGNGPHLTCGPIFVDLEKMAVRCQEEEVFLSHTEYQLLVLLLKNKGKTLTRQQLLAKIWDSGGSFVNDNTLTVTMKRLREKLHQPACLKTVRSFGYRMEETV